MATQAAQRFSFGTLARRFAGQVLLSGAAMLTLNAASHLDFGLQDGGWPGFADEGGVVQPRREAMVLPSVGLPGGVASVEGKASQTATANTAAPALALGREARLPVPARLFAEAQTQPSPMKAAPAPAPKPIRMAAMKPALTGGVLLFDQCRPLCETGDPLARVPALDRASRKPFAPARTRLAELEPARPAPMVKAADADIPTEASTPPIASPLPADQPGLLTRSLSTARDTTRSAAGSLARLVSW